MGCGKLASASNSTTNHICRFDSETSIVTQNVGILLVNKNKEEEPVRVCVHRRELQESSGKVELKNKSILVQRL